MKNESSTPQTDPGLGQGSGLLAKLLTFSLLGIEAMAVEVEVDVSPSAMPKTILVGLPEAAVRESVHRCERAIVNSGFVRPADRVVINLAPAELPKQAASFDLPISLGILIGSGQFQSDRLKEYAVVGELALEGHTRPAKGVLSMAIKAKELGFRGIVVPEENAYEAAVVEDLDVIAVNSLAQAAGFFAGSLDIDPTPSRINDLFEEFSRYDIDFADVRGQEMAKRAITVAAAGSHNLLMLGPPGSGEPEYMRPIDSNSLAANRALSVHLRPGPPARYLIDNLRRFPKKDFETLLESNPKPKMRKFAKNDQLCQNHCL